MRVQHFIHRFLVLRGIPPLEKRRVVITGMGVVAPNGIGVENFWEALVHGRSAVRRITHFDASSYPCQVAAEVPDFDPTDYMDPKTAKRLARFAQFALAASKMAIRNAEVDLDSANPHRAGVVMATGIGGGDCSESQHTVFMEKGLKRIGPSTAVMICTHSAAGMISCDLGIKGPNTTISAGCTSGLDAVYSAYNSIRLGDADLMLAGAGEAPITPYIVAIFCASGLLSGVNDNPKKTVKPYDVDGDGTALGEGGAALVLEDLQGALGRKARIYGEILGYASGNEAYNIFRMDPTGDVGAEVMRRALQNANVKTRDIDYINAHGNGSPEYDLSETIAIKKVFREFAYRIPITSIKPVTGQSFSVTGILQTIASLLTINTGIIPPTLNHIHPQPSCDLDYVRDQYREGVVNHALMNSLGYGGGHTAVIVSKFR